MKSKFSMPPIKRQNPRARTKSNDNVRVIELRKERSRDAARNRRGKENLQFDELAKMLPLPDAITSQLDKASIVRLTISYLSMKEFSGITPRQNALNSNSSMASASSLPSDSSPLSEPESDFSTPTNSKRDYTRDRLAMWSRKLDDITTTREQLDPHQSSLIGSSSSKYGQKKATSPAAEPQTSNNTVAVYKRRVPLSDMFESETGIHTLQALDGFLFVVSEDGKFLYVSETVSVHLGLSQVELTGNNMFGYVHPEDHDDLNEVLTSGYATGKPVPSPVCDIPLFGKGPLTPDPSVEDEDSKSKPLSFFVRMKCTLVRRGGSYTKSSGFKVIHCVGRLREYRNDNGMSKFGLVCIGQPLPQLSINELPLECNMFVSRVGMDLKIVYCEGRIHKFMDYYAKDIVGISAYDFYHMGDVSLVQDAHLKFLTKGQIITKYYRWMNKNGGWVWMQTKASLIPHPDNPEIKQMLCLNYIVSNVEHRGVVLGMTQLKDKPKLQTATITEIDSSIEPDDTGELVDASIQDNCVIFPKWQKCQGNELFARQSNADTYPFGFGSPTGGGFNLDNEVFPQWQGSDKQSDFEDNLEDLQELIDSEMTDFDRDLANFVVNGSELPVMLRPPDDDLPVSEDLPGNNMFCAGNLQTSSVPTSGFTAPGQSVSLPSLSKQPVISARKRMAGEDFLEFDDNTGMYTAVVPSLSSSTPRQASVIQSKVPRLNHMSSIPTVTNSAPVPSASAAGSQGLSSMQTQGVPQPNIPSYQMESARYQQNNNGLITANSFQVGNHNRVGGNLNQMAGGAVQGLAPAQGEIVNRTNSYTDELMVDLVDDMLTDPRLHIANEFQKQQDLSNQDRSFDNQGQFKSSSYPLLETKIKQEAPSPTTTQPSFFGTCIGEGNFCQVSENSGTRLNSTAAVGNNTNLRQYSSFQQPSILTHMNQPPNGTMLQGMCPPSSQRSAAFPNQNMGERTFNYLPQTISGGNMQSTEFVSSQMKPQLKQRRLGTLLQQETAPRNLANCNVNSQANFNGTQQQPFSTSDQQNYTIHSTQNNMVSQRKQGLNPSQNVSHHPGFSIANSAPVGFPGSQANTFQGLNSSSNPNIR